MLVRIFISGPPGPQHILAGRNEEFLTRENGWRRHTR